jgi:hypothetical protein
MAKVKLNGNMVEFKCPGCNEIHKIDIGHPLCGWNNDINSPSIITPYIHYKSYDCISNTINCHYTIEKGKINFLKDCKHNFSDKTIELPEI